MWTSEIPLPKQVKDLKGKWFGKLTVLKYVGVQKQKHSNVALWLCECLCGNKPIISSKQLKKGTKSCGCHHIYKLTKNYKNIRYGLLVGIRNLGRSRENRTSGNIWLWQCDCGSKPKEIAASEVISGTTRSCGCSKINKHINTALNNNSNRKKLLSQKYGITLEDWQTMFATQGKKCAICGTFAVKRWATDHCHSTGKIRGILCNNCNTSLGGFKDNPINLLNAIAYLYQHSSNQL